MAVQSIDSIKSFNHRNLKNFAFLASLYYAILDVDLPENFESNYHDQKRQVI